jgi:thiamine biosynthesis protein ThiS
MQIVFNGESRDVRQKITVAQLLDELALDPRRVAVEVNLELVSRDRHVAVSLQEGDQLEVVTLVGGG